MYNVIVKQSPELAARQAQADNNSAPYTKDLKPYVEAKPWPLSEATLKLLEPITVESIAYSEALDLIPQNEIQARKLKAIIDRGPTYVTGRWVFGNK